jgi:hypothetical protein
MRPPILIDRRLLAPSDSGLQGVEWRAAPRRRQADQRIPGMSGVPESRTSTVSNIARLNNPLRIF